MNATSAASRPQKRSFSIRGHRTSISLETAFWEALREVAAQRAQSLAEIVGQVDEQRGTAGLSSAVRIFVLAHYRGQALQGQTVRSIQHQRGPGDP